MDKKLQAVIDKSEIIEVSTVLLCCRDAGDWERLAQCFHPDAHVTTSWFSGTAREFVVEARKMMEGHHSKDTQRHVMSNPIVNVNGNRAVCEYYIILHQGRTMDAYEFDLQTWSVTVDLFEKRNGAWRICKRSNIYEKDRLDAHAPGSVPQSYYDQMDLSRYPAAVRYHCYRNERSSGVAPKLILKGSDEEEAARREAKEWLAGGGKRKARVARKRPAVRTRRAKR